MKPLIFLLLIFLIGCGERPDQNMKCDNGSNEYVNCTPDVIRRILKKCKENNMSYIHMVYESTKVMNYTYDGYEIEWD